MAKTLILSCFLKALTAESKNALQGQVLRVMEFPFRVGRESRGLNADSAKQSALQRRGTQMPPNNDLYLLEQNPTISVSREHFQIEQANGKFILVDRGSTLGTAVEAQAIGGDHRGGRIELNDGDVIIVGSHHSGFIFKFLTEQT